MDEIGNLIQNISSYICKAAINITIPLFELTSDSTFQFYLWQQKLP